MHQVNDKVIEPSSGQATGTLVFFHGYGANGQEMADYVGGNIRHQLPHVKLRFPDGLLPTPYHPQQRSWFNIQDMLDDKEHRGIPFDGNIAAPRALGAMPDIHAYIDRILEEDGIEASQLIIAGFSQGAQIAFYSGLQRHEEVGGVFSISGPAIDQVQGINSNPPIMLLAGADEHSHFSGRQCAEKTHGLLLENGFDSELYLTPDNGHNICANSLKALTDFTKRHLSGMQYSPEISYPFEPA